MSVRDTLGRRVFPRVLVAMSTVRWPARTGAAVRRAFGRSARVELYAAFDDPYSAVALLGLVDRVARRRAQVVIEPVVERGIPGDPAVGAKREYAVIDARRLGRRAGLELTRDAPLQPEATAFLAGWVAATPSSPERTAFCAAAMRRLWFESDGPVTEQPYAALWSEYVGGAPPADGASAVRNVEGRMRRRRMYDTPAARVHGQWFFAHERLNQIEHRLDELGWTEK